MYQLFIRPSDMKRAPKHQWLFFSEFSTESEARDYALNRINRDEKDFYVKFVQK